MDESGAFRSAGRTLFSLGLVKGAEGNLSTFRGGTLRITRTGSRLNALEEDDILLGTLLGELPAASSDLAFHRRTYAERGEGAIAHAHPPGTTPEGPPGEHGLYSVADTLEEAVAELVARVRDASAGAER